MTRTGKPIGGGLLFSDEFDRERLLRSADFTGSGTRRFPIIIGQVTDWTIYADLECVLGEPGQIFKIPTEYLGVAGDIRLEFKEVDNLSRLELTIDDGLRSQVLFIILKNKTRLKVCCNIDSERKVASMWVDNRQIVVKNLKKYKFPKASLPVVVWNEQRRINIKECAGWLGTKSKELSIKTKRRLTI